MHPDGITVPSGSNVWQDHSADTFRYLTRFALVCALAAMAVMTWTRNINWDEFYFLSHVHAHLDGRLDRPLQTVFVHAFGWLSEFSANEVDQIAMARLVMLGFFGATCLSLHRIAAALADQTAADIAVLAFITSGFAIAHGASFRADPMAAGLLMCALALMMISRMGPVQIILAAVLCAFALLVTIKSALYLPVFIGMLVWRWDDRRLVMRCLVAAVLALALAAVLFFWHASGITAVAGAGAQENIGDAARVTLGGNGVLPRWPEVSAWLLLSAGAVIFIVVGLKTAPGNRMRIVLVLFAFPFLSVLFYRNAFPYFFPFAVPALMVAVAVGAQSLRRGLVWKLALVLMLASGAIQTQRAFTEGNAAQRATIAEVHRIFPGPIPYIDQNGMMSRFERVGFFMSTWGIANYRAAGKPVFADLIARNHPPLLLANRAELYAAMRPDASTGGVLGLLPEDAQVLRQAYVHHAGAIWLAGQVVTLTGGTASAQMPFAGSYRVETDGPVMINQRPVMSGDVLALTADPIDVSGPAGAKLRLIWNTDAAPLQIQLPETGLYAGFWRL